MIEILPADTQYAGVPYEGCAVTIPVGSDSYPGTVVAVSSQTVANLTLTLPKKIRIRRDDYRGVEGHVNSYTEDQRYVYFTDAEQPRSEIEYTYREKLGGYVQQGVSSRGAQRLIFGSRRYYRDPTF